MEIEKKENMKEIIEWIICIAIAVILALLVRHFIGTPTVVRQGSMQTTLLQGDRLILNRWAITTHQEIKVGEIITFEAPTEKSRTDYNKDYPVAIYENEPTNIFSKFAYYILEINKTSYIKRVIGVGGDHILIEDGKVYRNGEELKENYLQKGMETERTGIFFDIKVPEGYIFAMGDNRTGSMDCREFGCIPVEKVESKVAIRFWPFDKFGKI
ncbi:MAG: signal peptidase I [Clostridia bacterium]|nr:signal peptidase I [Clostridia bacterium]